MSNKGSKYKVGVLVLVSFFALIVTLLSLGITKYFRKTFDFMTVVESSVQGLEKGAKVKLKGVTIGQVTKIQLDTRSNNNNIFIIMAFDPKAFAQSSAPTTPTSSFIQDNKLAFIQELQENIKKGLRCQLQYQGITGNQYIEISYHDPKKAPIKDIKLFPNHPPYLPSIETVSVTNILSEAQDIVTKIAKIDFDKMSGKINDFLDGANKLINDKDNQKIVANLKNISKNLKLLTERLNKTLDEKNMNKFTSKFNQTIMNINEMVIAAKLLITYLEENPESLLRGKPQRPVVKPE
jgi:ABC-type transporter Mla subunit MlaD